MALTGAARLRRCYHLCDRRCSPYWALHHCCSSSFGETYGGGVAGARRRPTNAHGGFGGVAFAWRCYEGYRTPSTAGWRALLADLVTLAQASLAARPPPRSTHGLVLALCSGRLPSRGQRSWSSRRRPFLPLCSLWALAAGPMGADPERPPRSPLLGPCTLSPHYDT